MRDISLNIYCTECKKFETGDMFYSRFYKKVNRTHQNMTSYEGVCKECLIKEYQASLENFNGDLYKAIDYICAKYDLPFEEELVGNKQGEDLSKTKIFQNYIRVINSLPQYSKGVYTQTTKTIKADVIVAGKLNINDSDIDFINKDIKKIKENILKCESPNEHGKWMNSLREALLLKKEIENNIECSIKRMKLNKDDIILLKQNEKCSNVFMKSQIEHIKSIVENRIIVLYPSIDMNILGK